MSLSALPRQDLLEKASDVIIYDSTGKAVKFGDLFKERETIVVFIRHFFCGTCQLYVSQLATVKPESLEQAGKDLVIIGCGDFQPIKAYCETTGYKGKIYADPSRELHRLFELTESLERTPEGQQKRAYVANRSYLGGAFSSILQGPLKHLQHIGKQGNISQLGGEFILGPGNQCSYASRMQHTEDHVDVADLMREAGVQYP
ncbi:unnamed protein product [Somion occarium]|uniref:Thioredoxin-like protein AAED1 n=1 Tax=Somion occarium TaxID=3059160 RepID=A0ABP1CGM9_9APHY